MSEETTTVEEVPVEPVETTEQVEATEPEVETAEQVEETTSETETEETGGEEPAEFSMVWPEGYEASETFADITTEAAKAVGLADGKLAGEYTAKVLAGLQEAADKQAEADDAALKDDWGSEYQANMTECKAFVKRVSARAGLTDEDVAVLATPKGMRFIQAMRSELGEGTAAAGKPATSAADESWAHEVMTNPNHPDYKAFHNPSDPRWRSVNSKYNKIKGF